MAAAALGNTAILLLLLAEKADVNVPVRVRHIYRLVIYFVKLYFSVQTFYAQSICDEHVNLKLGWLYPRHSRLTKRAH